MRAVRSSSVLYMLFLKLFFSAAGVPGSDGDHNNAKSAEFNRRDCVLLIKAAKKAQKSAAAEINGRRRGATAPRKRSEHAAAHAEDIEDFGGDLFDRIVGGIEIADLVLRNSASTSAISMRHWRNEA